MLVRNIIPFRGEPSNPLARNILPRRESRTRIVLREWDSRPIPATDMQPLTRLTISYNDIVEMRTEVRFFRTPQVCGQYGITRKISGICPADLTACQHPRPLRVPETRTFRNSITEGFSCHVVTIVGELHKT